MGEIIKMRKVLRIRGNTEICNKTEKGQFICFKKPKIPKTW